jgi:hypothetical protein
MFAAGRQLPHLQKLEIAPLNGHTPDDDGGPEYPSIDSPLLLGPGDLPQLVACCPGLRELSLLWPNTDTEAGYPCNELLVLRQLTALTMLSVAGPAWNDDIVKAVLGRMSGEALPNQQAPSHRLLAIYCPL